MRILWRFLWLLLVLLPVSLAAVLFTGPGSQALLGLADRYSTLAIDYAGGTIAGRLEIRRLALATDSLRLEVHDIVAELAPGCLWRSALCFTQLQAGKLDITLLPGSAGEPVTTAATPEPASSELITFPLQLESNAISIASTHIQWEDGEWHQGAAQLRLRMKESSIDIFSAVLMQPRLNLRESEPAVAPAAGRIALGRIALPFKLAVDELVLEQPAGNFYGAAHQLQRLSLSGDWRNTELHIEQLQGEDLEWGSLSLRGDLDFAGDWPVSMDSNISLARPPLWEGLWERELTLSAQGTLASLALELVSGASPELVAQARLDALDRQLPFESSAQISWPGGLRLGDIEGMPAALAEVALERPVSASVEGSLQVQQFELHGMARGLGYQSLALTVAGSHEQGTLQLSNLLLRDSAGKSELRASGEVIVTDPLRASLVLQSDGFEFPQLYENTHGRLYGRMQLSAALEQGSWQLAARQVDVAGRINDLPARIQGHAGLGSGLLLSDSDLQAELNGAQLLLRSSAEGGQNGRIELTVEDLGRWQPGSRGQLQLRGLLSADWQQLQLTGKLADIQWQGMRIDRGVINGQYHDGAVPAFSLDVALQEVGLADIELSSVELQAGGTVAQHTIALASRGDVQGELNLTGTYGEQQWQASLAPTRLQTPVGAWSLSEPVPIAWAADTGQFSLAAHCWLQQQTRICPGDLLWAEEGKGSLALQGDMAFLAGFMPEGVTVQGEIQLQLDGAWNAADGLTIKGESLTRSMLLTRRYAEEDPARFGWDSGRTAITYDSDGLSLAWRVQLDGREVLALDVLLPPERDAPLSGNAIIDDLELDSLAPFAPMFSSLRGSMSGQLRFAGSVAQPLAQGLLTLSVVELALVGNPTQLKDLDLRLTVQGDTATVSGTGLLGGGEIQLDGQLASRPDWRLALSVSGEKHTIFYPPSTELLVSENLDFTASAGLLDIRGELIVLEGKLEPEQLPAGSVAISADVVEVDYAGNIVREELPFDLSMDVRVRVQDGFQVTGSLINATLGGDLQLLQQPRQPLQLFGNLNVIDGELRAYQQRLHIKRGTISFSGQPENPALEVRAQRDISGSNVIVGVQVRGTFDELLLEVFSEPAMSQGEAMSYLIRGRAPDASAGADSTALALSLASGVMNSSTLVNELNRIPGVNNIAFGAEGSEDDTSATVSGYIGNRIYLSYGFGLYEPINVLTARLYLRTRLWLEVVSSLENSLDLYYSFDID